MGKIPMKRYYKLTNEFTSVTLKTRALSLRGESLSHTYVGESFSIEPYVALTYGFAFLPNKPTRPLKFNLINFTESTPPVCTPRAQGRNVPYRYTKRNNKEIKDIGTQVKITKERKGRRHRMLREEVRKTLRKRE